SETQSPLHDRQPVALRGLREYPGGFTRIDGASASLTVLALRRRCYGFADCAAVSSAAADGFAGSAACSSRGCRSLDSAALSVRQLSSWKDSLYVRGSLSFAAC